MDLWGPDEAVKRRKGCGEFFLSLRCVVSSTDRLTVFFFYFFLFSSCPTLDDPSLRNISSNAYVQNTNPTTIHHNPNARNHPTIKCVELVCHYSLVSSYTDFSQPFFFCFGLVGTPQTRFCYPSYKSILTGKDSVIARNSMILEVSGTSFEAHQLRYEAPWQRSWVNMCSTILEYRSRLPSNVRHLRSQACQQQHHFGSLFDFVAEYKSILTQAHGSNSTWYDSTNQLQSTCFCSVYM